MTATQLADCTATELVQLYRTGQASPVEATQAVLSRIGEIDRVLNAFCLVDADRALESAKGPKRAGATVRRRIFSTACRCRSRT